MTTMPVPRKLPPAPELLRLSAAGSTYVEIAATFGVTKKGVEAAMRRAGQKSQLPRPSLSQRFWAKVDKTSSPKGCWLWTASTDGHGYGQFMVRPGKNVKAYRVAYELLRGPIAPGLTIDHLCRVKLCVNPAHLEPVTHRVNILRSGSTSAIHARQTYCVHGHEFTPANTYVYTTRSGNTRRYCVACAERRQAKRNADPAYKADMARRSRERYARLKAAG